MFIRLSDTTPQTWLVTEFIPVSNKLLLTNNKIVPEFKLKIKTDNTAPP